MRALIQLLLACGVALAALPPVSGPQVRPRPDDPQAREKALLLRRGGAPTLAELEVKARIVEQEMARWASLAPQARPVGQFRASAAPGTWVNIGPSSLGSGTYSPSGFDLNSGRLSAILTHPKDAKRIYVASARGGVWTCASADPALADWTWIPLTDGLPFAASQGDFPVGDLAMDPDDPERLYLGMGDRYNGFSAPAFYYSADGGAHWTKSDQPPTGRATHRILALGASKLVVATDQGVFRSIDGGRTFRDVGLPNFSTFVAHDLAAFSATDLALGGKVMNASHRWVPRWMYSSDGGVSWKESAFDDKVTALPLEAEGSALAAAGDGVGYALAGVEGKAAFAKGVMKTFDRGKSWTFQSSADLFPSKWDGRQFGYNMCITVDPARSQTLFLGTNLACYRSLDGGGTWTRLTDWEGNQRVYAHADFHTGAWSKTGPKTLLLGTDGGLAVLWDPLRSAVPEGSGVVPSDPTFLDHRRNKGLATHLIYALGSTTASNVPDGRSQVLVAMQDNSHGRRVEDGSGLAQSSRYVLEPSTGDGLTALIHPKDANRAIAGSYYSYLLATTTFTTPNPIWQFSSYTSFQPHYSFFTPLVPVPSDPSGDTVLTASSDGIYKSVDFGLIFSPIPMPTGINPFIFRLAASTFAPETFAFTNADITPRGLYLTQNGGAQWKAAGALPSPTKANVAPYDLSFSTSDPLTLYATSQYAIPAESQVFKSANLGDSWTGLCGTPAAPNGYPRGIPANVIRESKARAGTLYVGTDIGVYRSTNGGLTWIRFGAGLPYIRVEDLYEAPDGSFLRVATYGRGVWEVRVPPDALLVSPNPATLPAGGQQTFTALLDGTPESAVSWSLEGGGSLQATTGASTVYTAPEGSGSAKLSAWSQADPTRRDAVTITVKGYDLDHSGTQDALDTAYLARAFGTREGDANFDPAADFNGDDRVDEADLALFLARL